MLDHKVSKYHGTIKEVYIEMHGATLFISHLAVILRTDIATSY